MLPLLKNIGSGKTQHGVLFLGPFFISGLTISFFSLTHIFPIFFNTLLYSIKMFFVVNNKKEVVACCEKENEIYKTVITFMNKLVGGTVMQCIDWSVVDEDGYYYVKKDKNYVLRRYEFIKGYVYNSVFYEEIDDINVSYFTDDEKLTYLDLIKGGKQLRTRTIPITIKK